MLVIGELFAYIVKYSSLHRLMHFSTWLKVKQIGILEHIYNEETKAWRMCGHAWVEHSNIAMS